MGMDSPPRVPPAFFASGQLIVPTHPPRQDAKRYVRTISPLSYREGAVLRLAGARKQGLP